MHIVVRPRTAADNRDSGQLRKDRADQRPAHARELQRHQGLKPDGWLMEAV